MPPIESRLTGPIGSVSAVSFGVRNSRVNGSSEQPAKAETAEADVVGLSDTLDPGAAPVNSERVSAIRKALEQGTYPILPTSVADAIIAAGLILRTPK